jgi:hypothetical protein
MSNHEENADPEERIARLEAALRAERDRNAELQERIHALEGRQVQGGQHAGTSPSSSGTNGSAVWRRATVIMPIASVGLPVVTYSLLVFYLHQAPIFSLIIAVLFTFFTCALVIVLLATGQDT